MLFHADCGNGRDDCYQPRDKEKIRFTLLLFALCRYMWRIFFVIKLVLNEGVLRGTSYIRLFPNLSEGKSSTFIFMKKAL